MLGLCGLFCFCRLVFLLCICLFLFCSFLLSSFSHRLRYDTLGLLKEKRFEEWRALTREFLRILVEVREELKNAAYGMRSLSRSFEHLIKLFEMLDNCVRKIKELIEED